MSSLWAELICILRRKLTRQSNKKEPQDSLMNSTPNRDEWRKSFVNDFLMTMKIQNMKKCRVKVCKRRETLIKFVNDKVIWKLMRGRLRFCNGREFKKWRRKSMIWLVEWGKIIVPHVRHAFWWNFLTWSARRRREIFIFEVPTTMRTRSSKSFLHCLCMKTIRAKKAKVHSAYFVQRDQHGIIAKDLGLRTQSSILMWRFLCSCRRSFLNFLLTP